MLSNIKRTIILTLIGFSSLIAFALAIDSSSPEKIFNSYLQISADHINFSNYSTIVYIDIKTNKPIVGKPDPSQNISYRRDIYDMQNRLIERAYFNSQGTALPLTEIGIGAWQDTYDDDGRIYEEAYYIPKYEPTVGFQTSKYFVIAKVVKISYNESGKRSKEIEYDRNGNLMRTILISYRDGRIIRQFFNEINIKVYETDNINHLYFDKIEGGLIGISGPIPTDISPKNGWSEEKNRLKCTIGLESRHKQNAEINVYLTVANYTGHGIELKSTLPYKYLKPVLKKDGKAIPINFKKIEKRTERLIQMHHNNNWEYYQTVQSDNADILWGLNLKDWYDLDKGNYTIQVEINLLNHGIKLITPVQKFDIY